MMLVISIVLLLCGLFSYAVRSNVGSELQREATIAAASSVSGTAQITHTDTELTIYKVQRGNDFGTFPPKPGNTYLLVLVGIENRGKTQLHVNPLDFKIKDEDGYVALASISSGDQLQAITLEPDDKARGNLVFEIHKPSQHFTLFYTPLTRTPIKVELD